MEKFRASFMFLQSWLIPFYTLSRMLMAATVKLSVFLGSSPLKSKPPVASPEIPWMTRIAVSVGSRISNVVRRSDGTINRSLLCCIDPLLPPSPVPILGVSSYDVTIDPARDLWFRVFTPSCTSGQQVAVSCSLPVIFFFHGGGFTFLTPASFVFESVCRRFAKELRAVVVSVNYRLCPEYRFPSQYEDGWDVLKYVDEHAHELPRVADLGRSFLAGDSAGANMAHYMAVGACKSRLEAVRIRGLISIQPFFGGEKRTEAEIRMPDAPIASVDRTDWCWKAFLPEGEDRDHWASNVSGPNAINIAPLEAFPATLLFVTGFDSLRDWQKRYYEWLKSSGKEADLVEYPNMFHSFYVFPNLPESCQLIKEVKTFIARKAR